MIKTTLIVAVLAISASGCRKQSINHTCECSNGQKHEYRGEYEYAKGLCDMKGRDLSVSRGTPTICMLK